MFQTFYFMVIRKITWRINNSLNSKIKHWECYIDAKKYGSWQSGRIWLSWSTTTWYVGKRALNALCFRRTKWSRRSYKIRKKDGLVSIRPYAIKNAYLIVKIQVYWSNYYHLLNAFSWKFSFLQTKIKENTRW